jgi:hypothetical protein
MGRIALFCLSFMLPAAAQMDSSALHSKLGSPLHRETFHVQAGFDVVVDYASSGDVCRIQVPAMLPLSQGVSRGKDRRARIEAFLLDLVPDSIRGTELGRGTTIMSAASSEFVEYEPVTVTDLEDINRPFDGTRSVFFKGARCDTPASR